MKDILLLQRVMMCEIATLLFRGYNLLSRKVSVSASLSVCTVCTVFVRFMWINVTLSAAAQMCGETGGPVYSSGAAFMLHCSKRFAKRSHY